MTFASLKSAAALFLSISACATAIAAQPFLGAAQGFAALAGTTLTNTGQTTIHGDIGTAPGTAITGLASITLNGATHHNDAVARQAQIDALSAYDFLLDQPFSADLTGFDLGTVGALQPGVYNFNSSAQLTGTLTLDAGNDPNALFIFKIGSSLTAASNSFVNVLNGGANTGVYFQVGSSVTLGTGTSFAGNILANQSITLATGAGVFGGRLLALHGAVTLDGNTISNDCSNSSCANRSDDGSMGYAGGFATAAVPEPRTYEVMLSGLLLLGFLTAKRHMLKRALPEA